MELQSVPTLDVSSKTDIEPLDFQYGVKDKLTVPVSLESYFSQQRLNTYVLIDAASLERFHDLLSLIDTEYEILLGDSIKEDYKSVATYLFDLKRSKELLTWLFTEGEGDKKPSWCLADRSVGVFLQSEFELDELAYFFKKFTRLRDKQDKWRYFRFADSKFFSFMLEEMMGEPEYCSRWFYSTNKQMIENYSIYEYDTRLFKTFKATSKLQAYQPKQKPLIFDDYYQGLSDRYTDKLFSQKMVGIIKDDFSQYYDGDNYDGNNKELTDFIVKSNHISRQLGLKSEQARGYFIAASVFVGRTLDKEDLASVGFYASAMEHENRKTKKLLEQVINNIKRRSLEHGH
ncbi:DUF4123 domain-containing protein [Kangiella spongicola]|uniref:DUF4123 domain-containing protein n=1 Tax=Kangiella spongicola TaxID=796379 RepID=A0A318D4L4_9GAMM|nr:DUF4123 domain-containing protein [Kangiella spongicola]PXF63831.1 hypothetical protein DL796_01420 [Kangiella spongicola]